MQQAERTQYLDLIESRLYLPRGYSMFDDGKDGGRSNEAMADYWWLPMERYPLRTIEKALAVVLRKLTKKRPEPADLESAIQSLQSEERRQLGESRQCSFTSGHRRCPLEGYHLRHAGDSNSGWLCEWHHETRNSITDSIRVLQDIELNGPPIKLDAGMRLWLENLYLDGAIDSAAGMVKPEVIDHIKRNPPPARKRGDCGGSQAGGKAMPIGQALDQAGFRRLG